MQNHVLVRIFSFSSFSCHMGCEPIISESWHSGIKLASVLDNYLITVGIVWYSCCMFFFRNISFDKLQYRCKFCTPSVLQDSGGTTFCGARAFFSSAHHERFCWNESLIRGKSLPGDFPSSCRCVIALVFATTNIVGTK